MKRQSMEWEKRFENHISDNIYLIVSKIVVSFIVSIGWNYVLHKYFVFRDVHIQSRVKSLLKKA